MFKYTRAAIYKTVDDFKKFIKIFGLTSQILYIAYLIYALASPIGNAVVNVIFLITSLSYLGFSFYYILDPEKISKATKKITKRTYKWSKLAIKAYTLGATVYGICIAPSAVSSAAIILAVLTATLWLFQVILECIIFVFEIKMEFIMDSFQADIQDIMKPAQAVGDFVKRITRKEVEEKPNYEKLKSKLNKFISEKKQERKNKKEAKKLFNAKNAKISTDENIQSLKSADKNSLPEESVVKK